MILIAHRGNINGPNPERENHPDYISEALEKGYHTEVDVWLQQDGKIYLGHDEPQYLTTLEFLKHDSRIICHAKTIITLQFLISQGLHCFFHDKDAATITSKNIIWLYPGMPPCELGILVMPEWPSINYKEETWLNFIVRNIGNYYGICSDRVEQIDKIFKKK